MKPKKISITNILSFSLILLVLAGNAYAAQYWRGQCTKNWSHKFSSYQACREAAKAHEASTGHNSGCLGPYNG
jgi:hypothetical protein